MTGSKRRASVLWALVGAASFAAAGLGERVTHAGQSPALTIVVIEGEGAVNIIQQKTAVAPVVEVRDRNDQPVAGAVVRFAIQGGRATFNGSGTLTLTTNAAGRAAVTGLTPTGSGALQITASATFQGQTAAATIAQTNFATAAEAASASAGTSSAGAGGGGGIGPGTIAAVGGAVAGAVVVADKTGVLGDDYEPPEICGNTTIPQSGFASATVISFRFLPCDESLALTYRWNFGDGTTETTSAPTVNHVYASAGSFTATVVPNDGRADGPPAEQRITIASVTGRWRAGTANDFFDLVQSGNVVTGTYTIPAPGTGTGTVSGTVQYANATNRLLLTLAGPTAGTLDAISGGDLNAWNGTISGGGYATGSQRTLTRQ